MYTSPNYFMIKKFVIKRKIKILTLNLENFKKLLIKTYSKKTTIFCNTH